MLSRNLVIGILRYQCIDFSGCCWISSQRLVIFINPWNFCPNKNKDAKASIYVF